VQLRNKNILLISPEPWGINFVSKHHYAIELAKRVNKVYFLNPPTKEWSVKQEIKNLQIVNYKPKYRGLARIPDLLSAWFINREIMTLEKFCNTTFDIIWNFDSSRFFNLKLLKSKLRISHIVDQSENKNIRLHNLTADLCLTVTNHILKRQKIFNDNSFNIGHSLAVSDNTTSILLPNSGGSLRVGYLGNLLIKYLDWELIYELVDKNPEIYFYFAGPYTESNLSRSSTTPEFLQETLQKQNTFFIGSISSNQIELFLSQMDVLLLVYKTKNNEEQLANSHKLLEYFASGKVVISSLTDEYRDKRHLLEMVESNDLLPKKFSEVIQNLDYYNSPEKQSTRKAWARENTYKKQIERVEEILAKI
jgi:glycosyltransferase involved in cell wall biosynthesis